MKEISNKSIIQDLKVFYIPLNEIKVNVYKVLARNEEQAIQKVARNKNKLHKYLISTTQE